MKNAIDSFEKLKHSIEINISGVGSCDDVPFCLDSFKGDLSFATFTPRPIDTSGDVLKILDLIDTVPTSLSELLRCICIQGLYSTYLANASTFNYIYFYNQKNEYGGLKNESCS